MPWCPAVPPATIAAHGHGGGRIKKRAGLPRLLHRLFIKVLRLRPPPEQPISAAFEACCGYRVGSDEYRYYYGYDDGGGAASSAWAGVLSSIPEEEGPSLSGSSCRSIQAQR